MKIFDTHAHYDDDKFLEDRQELLLRLHEQGVLLIMNLGSTVEGCRRTLELAEEYPFVFGAIGIHPENISEMNEEVFAWLDEMLALKRRERPAKILAVGEIGLDYHWYPEEKETQKYWLRRQIALAKKHGLPVAIHARDAAEDTLRLLKEERADECGGVLHAFSASAEMAQEYVKMGMYIGVGGVITYKNGKKLRHVVETVPMDRIVIETDSPYMAPVPVRGTRNNSGNLVYVVEEIAKIKEISAKEVAEITFENGKKLYRFTDDP
ncbi:MAG: TatD family hydrolase [Lachnospiraceae bacterium]|nr:TatD family hydrolase [Lachnospiraceae bacterium]